MGGVVMNKKIFIICLVLSMSIFIAGCGDKITTTTTETTTTTTTTPTTTTSTTTTTTTTTSTTTTTIPNGIITGTVVLNGENDNGGTTISVVGTSNSTTTDQDGSFSLSIAPGTYSISISKSNFSSASSSNISVSSAATTNAGSFTLYAQYDMGSLEGTIISMGEAGGNLYIATDEKLYKVATSNPTTIVGSVTVTHNFETIFAGNLPALGGIVIGGAYKEGEMTKSSIFVYNESLQNTMETPDGDDIPDGATIFDEETAYIYSYSSFTVQPISGAQSESTTSVNISDIVSIESVNNYVYACNASTLYKFDTNFNKVGDLPSSTFDGGSNLIGIATDGTYIWVIDATTKKLHRITDIFN